MNNEQEKLETALSDNVSRLAAIRATGKELASSDPSVDIRTIVAAASKKHHDTLRLMRLENRKPDAAVVEALAAHGINLEAARGFQVEAGRLPYPLSVFTIQLLCAFVPAFILSVSLLSGKVASLSVPVRIAGSAIIAVLLISCVIVRVLRRDKGIFKFQSSGSLAGGLCGAAWLGLVIFGPGQVFRGLQPGLLSSHEALVEDLAVRDISHLALESLQNHEQEGRFLNATYRPQEPLVRVAAVLGTIKTEQNSPSEVRYSLKVSNHEFTADLKPASGILYRGKAPEMQYMVGEITAYEDNQMTIRPNNSNQELHLTVHIPIAKLSPGDMIAVGYDPKKQAVLFANTFDGGPSKASR